MTEYKAEFIRIPVHSDGPQTLPVEPEKRLEGEEIRVELCDADKDVGRIAEGLYTCFGERFWEKMEPTELRPPEQATRQRRLAERTRPSFTNSNMKWVKAVYVPTGETVGIAGWVAPGNPVHNMWRRSAVEFYGWQEKMGWSDEEIEEMWKGVGLQAWEDQVRGNDDIRSELLGEEPHWYLAPLFTWPAFQGRGVGTKLLDWAIKQADAQDPPVPMYLESAPTARAVYMHHGFKPHGKSGMLRRGFAVVRGLEAEGNGDRDRHNEKG